MKRDTWLYVSNGQARYENQKAWVAVNADEMLTLKEFSRAAVPYDAAVIALLTNGEPRTTLVWEATLQAQWRDGWARLGIGVAQATTFLTYLGIVLVPILTPVIIIIWFARKRMKGRQ